MLTFPHRSKLIGPNLRFPRSVSSSKEAIDKKSKKIGAIVKRQPIPKPTPCDHIDIGQVVLCKMRGFVEWPALVTGFNNNLIAIEFFGDKTTHKAAIKNFFIFEKSHDTIVNNIRSKKGYSRELYCKSVREAEDLLGVPREISILNQID